MYDLRFDLPLRLRRAYERVHMTQLLVTAVRAHDTPSGVLFTVLSAQRSAPKARVVLLFHITVYDRSIIRLLPRLPGPVGFPHQCRNMNSIITHIRVGQTGVSPRIDTSRRSGPARCFLLGCHSFSLPLQSTHHPPVGLLEMSALK